MATYSLTMAIPVLVLGGVVPPPPPPSPPPPDGNGNGEGISSGWLLAALLAAVVLGSGKVEPKPKVKGKK